MYIYIYIYRYTNVKGKPCMYMHNVKWRIAARSKFEVIMNTFCCLRFGRSLASQECETAYA